MTDKETIRMSKFLSLILRHEPERVGIRHRAGHVFYRSTNGVWLVDSVPVQFIDFPQPDSAP
jgi:RNA:NAD 2'-phosphotransferase (TPT1/KptA family)